MNPIMQIIVSLVAIAMLTGLAWLLGFRRQPLLDETSACAEAAAALPGFRAAAAMLADDRRQALVRGHNRMLALVFGHGDGWVVRVLPPGAIRTGDDRGLFIDLAEPPHKPRILVPAGPLPDWPELAS